MPRERINPHQDDARREPRSDELRGAPAPAAREDPLEPRRPRGRSASTAVALVVSLAVVVIVLVFILW